MKFRFKLQYSYKEVIKRTNAVGRYDFVLSINANMEIDRIEAGPVPKLLNAASICFANIKKKY